jgi:hypothetical protein
VLAAPQNHDIPALDRTYLVLCGVRTVAFAALVEGAAGPEAEEAVLYLNSRGIQLGMK